MAIKAGVVKVPVVPVTPPPGEVHVVLLVDVQLRVDVAPFAIEDGTAVSVTTGNACGVAETSLDAILSPFILTAVTTKYQVVPLGRPGWKNGLVKRRELMLAGLVRDMPGTVFM